MNKKFLQFPKDFLWGTSTASHQVEADCNNNDWSCAFLKQHQNDLFWAKAALEQIPPSGQARDHLNKYREDFDLIKEINNNAYRFSVEWARIEPQKGKFDELAIQKYREMLESLKNRGITTMLTLHHFTNPGWLALEGGWEKRQVVKYFLRYTRYVVENLGDLVDLWITINEPTSYYFCGYVLGIWPPLKHNYYKGLKSFYHMTLAHKKAYYLIHQITKTKFNQPVLVGIANDLQAYTNYVKHKLLDQVKVYLLHKISNHLFYRLSNIKTHDFLGINYYFQVVLKNKKIGQNQNSLFQVGKKTTDTNWGIYPHGVYELLLDLTFYKKPIYITENGIATTDNDLRNRFIHEHLEEIYFAIQAGVNVKGYFHWSLLDNYEWREGYRPKFGLISVDPETQERKLKPSGKYYGQIAKENGVWMDY